MYWILSLWLGSSGAGKKKSILMHSEMPRAMLLSKVR